MLHQPKWAKDDAGYYKCCGYQALTVSSTAVSPTIPAGTRMARVFFRTDTVRLQLDGDDPVAGSSGIPLFDGYEEFFSIRELETMKLIREGANDATVYFLYYA